MRSARGVTKVAKTALRAVGKGAKTGLREGTRNAAKEFAHEHVKGFLKGAVGHAALAAPGAPIGLLTRSAGPGATARANYFRSHAAEYPAYCDCKTNPRARRVPEKEGHRILKCDECAPSRMSAMDYERTLLTRILYPVKEENTEDDEEENNAPKPKQVITDTDLVRLTKIIEESLKKWNPLRHLDKNRLQGGGRTRRLQGGKKQRQLTRKA